MIGVAQDENAAAEAAEAAPPPAPAAEGEVTEAEGFNEGFEGGFPGMGMPGMDGVEGMNDAFGGMGIQEGGVDMFGNPYGGGIEMFAGDPYGMGMPQGNMNGMPAFAVGPPGMEGGGMYGGGSWAPMGNFGGFMQPGGGLEQWQQPVDMSGVQQWQQPIVDTPEVQQPAAQDPK